MCLLAFYVNPDPKPGEFYLVLINVRDEVYNRPTKTAAFWDDRPDIIGGMDLEPGKEGGTWLAMNKNGKIGALLNILQPEEEILPNKKGRGFLAVDFVKLSESPMQYLNQLSSMKDDYNGFLMVALDFSSLCSPNMAYFTNSSSCPPSSLKPGIHAFGNSIAPDKPWPKVLKTKEKFTEIVNSHHAITDRDNLVAKLFHLLQDPTCYGLDDNMRTQGEGKSSLFMKKLSAIFVEVPSSNYGSRCHTVILVSGSGLVDYYEKSRDENATSNSCADWTTKHFSFQLGA